MEKITRMFEEVNNIFFQMKKYLGYVLDRCGCCIICARLEHELCDISQDDNRYGICGENLECRSRKLDGGVRTYKRILKLVDCKLYIYLIICSNHTI